jgi:Tol biopolymer transport system component
VLPHEDLLNELADAILDGTPIDWQDVAARANGRDRALLDRLKIVSDLATVHRGLAVASPTDSQSPYSGDPTADDGGHSRRWGHLNLLELVGRGAFGEVYRAHDTRLDRDVALKLLSSTAGEIRASAIIEEGRLLARIRHPNVVTIYGAERRGDHVGLWMEFVEGQTLEQMLQQGRVFTVAETVDIGIQLCHALTAVHDAGLLHRDIKAQNVMLADDGRVVLMDFGTGWEVNPDSRAALAGTPLYLAPEVLAGGEPTIRSDLYSLGVVLYHLLTGSYPVAARTIEDLRWAHARAERVAIKSARPEVPPDVGGIIERATDPRPERRPESASATAAKLRAAQTHAPRRGWAGVALLALVVSLLVAVPVFQRASRTSAASDSRASAALAVTPITSSAGNKNYPALSPDGTRVAFIWMINGEWELYVKDLTTDRTTRMTEEGAGYPMWSPDGRFLAFRRESRDPARRNSVAVLVIPASGGPERIIWQGAPRTLGNGHSWSADGSHIAISARGAIGEPLRVLVVDATTSKTRWLSQPPSSTLGDSYPAFSPDGRSIAFVRTEGADKHLYLLRLASAGLERLPVDGHDIRGLAWSPDGKTIIFTSYRGAGRDTLWRVPVAGGEAERVIGIGEGASAPSVGGRGRMVYLHTMLDQDVYRVELPGDSSAKPLKLATSSRRDTQPDISPDGTRIAFVSDRAGSAEIWLIDAEGGNPRQLTTFGTLCRYPRWSPDGHRIVSAVRLPSLDQSRVFVTDVSTGASRQITHGPGQDLWPQWSGDGNSIYFASDRSGNYQIWKVAAAGGEPVQLTRDGGFKSWESSDGRYLYYSDNTRAIWRMPVTGGPSTMIVQMADETAFGGEWVLSASGIHWLRLRTTSGPLIEFLAFATGVSVPVVALDTAYDYGSGFSVSKDEQWLAFSHREYDGSDVMMIEGMR